jgi:hypothetical protein
MESLTTPQTFIEIQEYDPLFEANFQEMVLNRYLSETFSDLLNREMGKEPTKLTFKVFSEVSNQRIELP